MRKRCARCEKIKLLSKFPLDPRTPSGRFAWCKKCHCGYQNKRRSSDPGIAQRSELQRQHRKAENPKQFYLKWWTAYLQRNYGLSLAQHREFLRKQRGKCAICRRKKPLQVDHEHGSKPVKVRGLLCAQCNSSLGKFGDSALMLRRAAQYLEGRL